MTFKDADFAPNLTMREVTELTRLKPAGPVIQYQPAGFQPGEL
jgi:hypothetical protein